MYAFSFALRMFSLTLQMECEQEIVSIFLLIEAKRWSPCLISIEIWSPFRVCLADESEISMVK
jgi:hypothetical protein